MRALIFAIVMPLTCFAVVSKGPGSTYHVDQWGNPMAPSKGEVGEDLRRQILIHEEPQVPVSHRAAYYIPVK